MGRGVASLARTTLRKQSRNGGKGNVSIRNTLRACAWRLLGPCPDAQGGRMEQAVRAAQRAATIALSCASSCEASANAQVGSVPKGTGGYGTGGRVGLDDDLDS